MEEGEKIFGESWHVSSSHAVRDEIHRSGEKESDRRREGGSCMVTN